jgi:hypothetical protein
MKQLQMKQLLVTTVTVVLMTGPSLLAESTTNSALEIRCTVVEPELRPTVAAIETAKIHVRSIILHINGGAPKAPKGVKYAPKVQLLAGHELLKDKFQLAPAGARAKGAVVARDKLMAAMAKVQVVRQKQFVIEKMEQMLKTLKYTPMKTKEGAFVVNADGKRHFTIKRGDILLKVSPPKGDFLLLQMRLQNGKWVVVAEYID